MSVEIATFRCLASPLHDCHLLPTTRIANYCSVLVTGLYKNYILFRCQVTVGVGPCIVTEWSFDDSSYCDIVRVDRISKQSSSVTSVSEEGALPFSVDHTSSNLDSSRHQHILL